MTKQSTHATRAAALATTPAKLRAGIPLAVLVQGETNLRASAPTAAPQRQQGENMGLDISAYRGIEKVDCVVDADGDPISPTTREPVEYDVRAYVNPDFPGRADGVEDRAVYKASDSMGFNAGGYGGYNAWREQLAKLAGFPAAERTLYGTTERRHDAGAWAADGGPFWELINFSDCEGVIGPVVSAKLAKDFQEHDTRAQAIGGHFYDKYQEWRVAFEMAADHGLVSLH